jgi:hypothetical protein
MGRMAQILSRLAENFTRSEPVGKGNKRRVNEAK